MKYELGEILFERVFESRDADGNIAEIRLQVSKPRLDSERARVSNEAVWLCTHLIAGIGDEPIFPAWGEDALEALMISLETAQSVIEHHAYKENKIITWLGHEDLRLPKMKPFEAESERYTRGFEAIFNEFFRQFGNHPDPK